MRFTQQILGRKKPALEAEEVVDQSVIDSLPAETETPAEAEAPADDVVADATEPTVADEPAVPVEGEATDLPAEEPVAEPVADEPGAGEIVPPDAEAVDVAPTTADGTVTVDQVESVLAGDEPEAAEAVAEADTLAGEPTTPEEVVAETDQVQEALGDDAAATDLPSEPGLPGDEPGSDLPVDSIEPGVDGGAVEEPASDTGTDEPLSDEPAAVDEPVAEPIDATDGVEGGEPAALEDGQTAETPAPSDAPLPGTDPATEDCACEEGDLGAQDVVAAQVDEAEVPVGDGEGIAQTDVPIEGAGTETLGEPGADPIAEPATDEVVADDDNFDFQPYSQPEEVEGEGQVLEEALDTYPQVTELLEDSLDNGGISNEAMQLLNIFTKRDGIPVNSNVSLESYNHTARTQTRVALEGIKDNIKGWAEDFIAWLKKTAQALIEWVQQQFSRVDKLLAVADELASADLSAGVATGEVTGGFLNRIKVDGAVPANWRNEVSDSVNTLVGYMTILNPGVLSISQTAFDIARTKVLDVVMSGQPGDGDYRAAFDEISEGSKSKFVQLMKQCDIKAVESSDQATYMGLELVGDVRFVMRATPKTIQSIWMLPTAQVISKDSKTPESAPALAPATITTTAKDISRLLNTIKKADSAAEGYKSLSAKMIAEMERIKNMNDNQTSENNRASKGSVTSAQAVIRNLTAFTSSSLTTSVNLSLGLATGVLGYLSAAAKPAASPAAEEPAQA